MQLIFEDRTSTSSFSLRDVYDYDGRRSDGRGDWFMSFASPDDDIAFFAWIDEDKPHILRVVIGKLRP